MPNDCLTNGEIRLEVSRHGAELVSLTRRGVGFLYRDGDLSAPTQGWANHATVMGYFLHRLKNERSLYRGRLITGGTHGFLRKKDWPPPIVDEKNASLTYRMTREEFTELEYPLNVSLDLTYAIDGEDVRVTFYFVNHETELAAHVGFGLHPGFAATSFESFHFEMPPGLYRRHFSPNNFLSGETEDIEFGGGEMPFARDKLPGSYILEFVDVPERRFRFVDLASGRAVSLDLHDVPYLTLWSDGGPFLCIEPCWGLTDYDQQRAFEEKEGIQHIPPSGELRANFSMTPRLTS
ncbi:MAG: hypothetical protein M3128_13615 [Verrucomicrobiota bacterium]|nr:hypothetical protein [Verrucomicrobiota bacterium]